MKKYFRKFLATSSIRASEIEYNLKHFQRNKNIEGELLHIIISPKIETITPHLKDYKKFLSFRKNEIYPKIRELGIIAGSIFLHLWSVHCKICEKPEPDCKCRNQKYFWSKNPHFHVIGFGNLDKNFHNKYLNFIIIDAKERKNIFATAYYILSHVAIWKENSRKKPKAYEYFGLRK